MYNCIELIKIIIIIIIIQVATHVVDLLHVTFNLNLFHQFWNYTMQVAVWTGRHDLTIFFNIVFTSLRKFSTN